MIPVLEFIAVFLVSLLSGTFFGLWWGVSPAARRYTAEVFTEVHNKLDDTFGRQMPYLFIPTMLSQVLLLFLGGIGTRHFLLTILSLLCVIAIMVSTLSINVPINKMIHTWSADKTPADWKMYRDKWERFHTVRTVLGLVALACQILALL